MKFTRILIGITAIIAYVLLFAGCSAERGDTLNPQSIEVTELETHIKYAETRDHDEPAKVVFHEIVPTTVPYLEYFAGEYVELYYTDWIPTTIIECCGTQKRYTDQAVYEKYQAGQEITITVTDMLDEFGNIVDCDFYIG